MATIGVHEAKTTLSQLLKRVAAGEEIVISNGGTPVARLVAIAGEPLREIGFDEGRFVVPEDFDAPLPDAVYDLFEK